MLAGQLERACCVLPRSYSIASCGKDFRPAQLRPGGEQQHAVRFLELAPERQVPIGFLMSAQDSSEQDPGASKPPRTASAHARIGGQGAVASTAVEIERWRQSPVPAVTSSPES